MAYANSFRCVVAIPTRELFSGDVYYADVPGFAGHYGVVKGHESLVATNHQGGKLTLWLDPEGKETKTFLLHRGCTQMLHDHLAVLGRFGCDANDIDVDSVKEKAEKLRAKIEEMKAGEQDETSEAQILTEEIHLSWYEAQIDFAETGRESYKQ